MTASQIVTRTTNCDQLWPKLENSDIICKIQVKLDHDFANTVNAVWIFEVLCEWATFKGWRIENKVGID